MEIIPDIMMTSQQNINQQIDPYFIDWLLDFSPIEEIAWNSIRSRGVPLYPQFSLFNYFIDFANPVLKIGLEMDGKEFHDTEKDRERDTKLAEYWPIASYTIMR